MPRKRTRITTETSSFGQGSRVQHDATIFYSQFEASIDSVDETVQRSELRNVVRVGDARSMSEVPDSSVALVVTSPPYFAAKAYETNESREATQTFPEYLDMLREVLTECHRVLEPGGRLAINVANLGRRPYRSLSARVALMMEECGYLMRGEIIWIKSKGSSSSLAWGSFASAANPVLRDVTERILIGCKGRFDRAIERTRRAQLGMPYENTIGREDFQAWTLDTWYVAPEHAKRIGHPAPYPLEIPRRLIELYSYVGDLILDPFVGSGSTCIAATNAGRDYLGFDTNRSYVDLANRRLEVVPKRLF